MKFKLDSMHLPVKVQYTNWRGETAIRNILPVSLRFGSTEWHPEPQWLLLAKDVDKGEDREFALLDMQPVDDDQSAGTTNIPHEA